MAHGRDVLAGDRAGEDESRDALRCVDGRQAIAAVVGARRPVGATPLVEIGGVVSAALRRMRCAGYCDGDERVEHRLNTHGVY